MLDDRQLVHPVHERMTFLNDALQFTADAGDELIPGKQITGIYRHLFCTQKVGFDPVFPELGPLNKSVIFEFLDYPRTFTAVDTESLPELALENSLRVRLNQFQCLFNRIFHGDHLSCFQEIRGAIVRMLLPLMTTVPRLLPRWLLINSIVSSM